jgi:hypothetical protein
MDTVNGWEKVADNSQFVEWRPTFGGRASVLVERSRGGSHWKARVTNIQRRRSRGPRDVSPRYPDRADAVADAVDWMRRHAARDEVPVDERAAVSDFDFGGGL